MTLAERLVSVLRSAGQTVAFCESLTAGLATATLADVPGASAVLRGGLITYATDLKAELAGVPPQLLAEHGPVSEPVAAAMAAGARTACGSDWAVALTGVAGPEGQDGHPVGEVWLGIAGPGWPARALRAEPPGRMRPVFCPAERKPVPVIEGDRPAIRRASVDAAFRALIELMAPGEEKDEH